MDRECRSLLPRVCEVLAASGGSLPDDTSLEKLLDWFTALTKAGYSLLEDCPGLHEFISTVVHNTTSDPGVLSFVLRLTGLIAATEDGFRVFQESSVLDLAFSIKRWQEAELWEDPCMRIGWIQGLRTMLQHPKALHFFLRADFLEPLLQLQIDSSLFVASAASHLLAHVLLLCRPARPADCNGGEKSEADEATRTSAASLENLSVAQQDYTDEVAKITRYLKNSLVPKEKTQLHQSLQTLKLLASLLTRTTPPLRDTLLRTVAASLEELVAAEHSKLTLPLMEVIVAAYSSSSDDCVLHHHVSRLLSSMLSIKKPADLIHAAAAFLRGAHHDPVHTAQSVNVLLLPLDIMTGQTLLCAKPEGDAIRCSLKEQLKNKTSCTSVICVCLANTPQITLVDPDSLPCPPAAVVTAVLLLLQLCSGDASCSSAGWNEFFRNIVGNRKVQRCALEALVALSSSPGVEVRLIEVFSLLVQNLDSPDSDPTVLHKSYQGLVKWISVCTDVSSVSEQLRQDLLRVVQKRACDVRWEVRDSTLEFLGHLAGMSVGRAGRPCPASDALLGGRGCTVPLLKEALQDPESYVRASAVAALAQTLAPGWQQGAALTQEETELVSRLLEILSEDTEGFARRAVVRYFIAWFSSHSSHSPPPSPSSSSSSSSLLMQSVLSVLSRGSADLDWEVKVHALQLAELLLADAFSGRWGRAEGPDSGSSRPHPYAVNSNQAYTLHTHTGTRTEGVESDLVGALSGLVERGVLSALLSGLVDCDRPVGLKACRLLIALRDTVRPLSRGPPNPTAAMATIELPGRGWAGEIRKILATKNRADAASRRRPDAAEPEDCGEAGEGDASVCVSVCEVLRSLGLDERLDVLTQSSDHVHNSPLSLLQDILAASAAHKLPDTQAGEEVIVDCY